MLAFLFLSLSCFYLLAVGRLALGGGAEFPRPFAPGAERAIRWKVEPPSPRHLPLFSEGMCLRVLSFPVCCDSVALSCCIPIITSCLLTFPSTCERLSYRYYEVW